jgi:hypothetical protein
LQGRQPNREIGGVEHHPHEKMAGLEVVKLLGVAIVLPIMRQECGDDRDDVGRSGQDSVSAHSDDQA